VIEKGGGAANHPGEIPAEEFLRPLGLSEARGWASLMGWIRLLG
jgi:hypothetical protein